MHRFCTPNYQIVEVCEKDLSSIVDIYNSNPEFLQNHIGVESVEEQWVWKEQQEMREIGFSCCKITESKSGDTVGFLDFKVSTETYLSLMMIHQNSKNTGIGKEVLQHIERYVKSQNSTRIRIDVVTGYNDSVMRFWQNHGFVAEKEILLSWNRLDTQAMRMIKPLI